MNPWIPPPCWTLRSHLWEQGEVEGRGGVAREQDRGRQKKAQPIRIYKTLRLSGWSSHYVKHAPPVKRDSEGSQLWSSSHTPIVPLNLLTLLNSLCFNLRTFPCEDRPTAANHGALTHTLCLDHAVQYSCSCDWTWSCWCFCKALVSFVSLLACAALLRLRPWQASTTNDMHHSLAFAV